jgi:hypothetical protein
MSVGAQLRASREARGLSIDAVAHTTRVQARILAAIERDDLSAVPPPPFGRGFVRAYAREMGLDGDRTARDYFAQFAPAGAPSDLSGERGETPGRGWLLWPLAVVSVGVLAGVGLALLTGRPEQGPGGAETPVPQSSRPPAQPSNFTPAPGNDPSTETRGAGAPAPAANLTIVLTAMRPCWVAATADGRRVVYGTVVPGAPQTLSASDEIVIRVGDAGGLSWSVNGRESVLMGQTGEVRDVRVTPATAATIR